MEQTLKDMLYDLRLFKTSAIYFCKLNGNKLGRKEWKICFMQTAGGEQFAIYQIDYLERTTAGFYTPDIDEAIRYANDVASRTLSKNRDFDFDWHVEAWEEKEKPLYQRLNERHNQFTA